MKNWIDFGLIRDFAAEQTDAYRLCTALEGWVERFGSDVLISYKTDSAREQLLAEFGAWSRAAAQPAERIFGRFLPKQNAERIAPRLLFGDATLPLARIVSERGVRYAIDFGAGYSAGLFLDQRENRGFVRRKAPRRLLNCFAYTCSFSVVAALGGSSTLNVDLSRKSLDRGRENFALNRLATDQHRFLADDVIRVLPRLARKGETFDAIILDPPTFSRARTGKSWQVARDFEGLLLAALEVATRDARILLSTNSTGLDQRALEAMARFCLKASRRAGSFQPALRPLDFPRGAGASSLWLMLR
ncbi:MAG: class I SAM-dependent rRNA methyltransferase [Chthoniobacterales bacterium]|nr:class I SAM-dependent rRNA methyltransferase [Chthoniobacterales bacterium]